VYGIIEIRESEVSAYILGISLWAYVLGVCFGRMVRAYGLSVCFGRMVSAYGVGVYLSLLSGCMV